MVRQFSIKKIILKIMMLLMSIFILISSFACTLTPLSFGIAELLYSTCTILNAEIYDTNGNHIETDEYGRVLATTFNVGDKNTASKKDTIFFILFFILMRKRVHFFNMFLRNIIILQLKITKKAKNSNNF
jgi:hypothetical protein